MDYREQIYYHTEAESEAPFPPEEFQGRLSRIRSRMAEAGVDMLYLMAPDSMYYVSGHQNMWHQAQSPHHWPARSAVVVHVDHDKYILFDSEREGVLNRIYTHSVDTRIFVPKPGQDSFEFIIGELKAEGWLSGTVGMEMRSYRPNRAISERLQSLLESAGARVVDGTNIVREVRHRKSPAEIACLEEASRIANIGMRAARDSIRAGVTELEVYGEIVRALAAAGGENTGLTIPVLSGSKTMALHALASRRKIQNGEPVLVDLCGVFKKYHINIARTFHVGEPAKEVMKFTDTIAGSMEAIRAILRPNLGVGELNDTIVRYFTETDLWDKRNWLGGYEMGIGFPPDWVGNFVYEIQQGITDERVFEPSTAVNYENQFFLPGASGQYFGIGSFLFKEDGARILSDLPFELLIV